MTGYIRVRQEKPGAWVPGPDGPAEIAAGSGLTQEDCARELARQQARKAVDAITAEITAEIRAVICGPLGLDGEELDRLAPYGKAGPGLCSGCLTWQAATTAGGSLCYYCGTAKKLAARFPQDPVARCGNLAAPAWTVGACGCASPQAHEFARHQVTCGARGHCTRDGQCRRCGAEGIVQAARKRTRPDPLLAVLLLAAAVWAACAAGSGNIFLCIPALILLATASAGTRRLP